MSTTHQHAPIPGTMQQIDAHDLIADCACGARLLERETGMGVYPWRVVN
jgi:hypothetical protein